jgi:hypothetical protein
MDQYRAFFLIGPKRLYPKMNIPDDLSQRPFYDCSDKQFEHLYRQIDNGLSVKRER